MVYKHAIFMRLSTNPHNGYDGLQTVREYQVFMAVYGEAWFSTGALGTGMSERMRCEFQDAIDYNYVLELYFALPKTGGGGGDIAFRAEVTGIETNRVPILTPDPELTPEPWRSDARCTWLKIRNLQATDAAADDFVVLSTGSPLASALKTGYPFGYIKRVG